jgi:Mrp family chromosome partitioning ATPase
LLGIEAGTGLVDVLTGHVGLPTVLRGTQNPSLRVLLSGTSRPTPSDLLSTSTMTSVLRRLEQEDDYVILHAPPVLSYADAAVVSSAASGTVVSVTAGRTRAQELTAALTALANVGVTPMGLVMTGARQADRSSTVVADAAPRTPPVNLDSPTLQHEPVVPSPPPPGDGTRKPESAARPPRTV